MRDCELIPIELEFTGDEGVRVIVGVRAGYDWDPVLYLRVLARRIDRIRVVLAPRPQDDQVITELHRFRPVGVR